MKNWLAVLAVLLLLAASLALYSWRAAPAVPVVKSIPLSSWLLARDIRLDVSPEEVESLRAYGPEGAIWLVWASHHGKVPTDPEDLIAELLDNMRLKRSNSYDEQSHARWALGYLSLEDADPAVLSRLVEALPNDSPHIPFHLIDALNRMLPASLPVLLDAAQSPDPHIRYCAIYALQLPEEILARLSRAETEQVAQTIRSCLKSPVSADRSTAILAILRGGSSTTEVYRQDLPSLMGLLDDPLPFIRSMAASTLALFGPDASSGVSKLTTLLSDPQPSVRFCSALALAEIDEAQVSKAEIAKLTSDPDSDCRAYAEIALASYAPNEVDRLLDLLKHADANVRLEAAVRLPMLGPEAARSAAAILESLRLPNAPCREGMIVEFIRFGKEAAISSWIEALGHPHLFVQEQAAEAFYRHPKFLENPAALAAVKKAAATMNEPGRTFVNAALAKHRKQHP